MGYKCHDFCDGQVLSAEALNEMDQGISDIEQQLAEYINTLAITKFTVIDTASGKSVLEIGSEVTNVTFAWAFSKTPKTVTLDGVSKDTDSTGDTLSENVTNNKTWTLVATNDSASVEKKASLTFHYCVFYGALSRNATINSDTIRGLNNKPQADTKISFSVNPNGKRPVFALPSDGYDAPIFKIGGFEYEWEKIAERVSVNDAAGTPVDYDVWMHPQNVTGSITINVT